MLNATIDHLVMKIGIPLGVMLKFEKVGPDPPFNPLVDNENVVVNRNWTSTRNLIIVRSTTKGYSVGNWPIPESFFPDPSNQTIYPRNAHPVIKFTCASSEPAVINQLPFDKYELDASPLTQYILSRKQSNVAWQVYVQNSQRNSDLGQPFGYLKASSNAQCVNLFVLPYNYPALFPLLDELKNMLQGKPTRAWRDQFENYLKEMPIYYASPLKKALQRMGLSSNFVSETYENMSANYLSNVLKKHKSLAKIELDKFNASVGSIRPVNFDWLRVTSSPWYNSQAIRKNNALDTHCSNPFFRQLHKASLQEHHQDFTGLFVRYKSKCKNYLKSNGYLNPFDIERHELVNQINKLRDNFYQKQLSQIKYQDKDLVHNLPVGQMGNYQDYLKRMASPLRELEPLPKGHNMFGNPYKIDKNDKKTQNMMIDEADCMDPVNGGGGPGNQQNRGNKRSAPDSPTTKSQRRKGPLSKDYDYFSNLLSISRSRSSSPCPSPSQMLSPSPNHLNLDGFSMDSKDFDQAPVPVIPVLPKFTESIKMNGSGGPSPTLVKPSVIVSPQMTNHINNNSNNHIIFPKPEPVQEIPRNIAAPFNHIKPIITKSQPNGPYVNGNGIIPHQNGVVNNNNHVNNVILFHKFRRNEFPHEENEKKLKALQLVHETKNGE